MNEDQKPINGGDGANVGPIADVPGTPPAPPPEFERFQIAFAHLHEVGRKRLLSSGHPKIGDLALKLTQIEVQLEALVGLLCADGMDVKKFWDRAAMQALLRAERLSAARIVTPGGRA